MSNECIYVLLCRIPIYHCSIFTASTQRANKVEMELGGWEIEVVVLWWVIDKIRGGLLKTDFNSGDYMNCYFV